MRVSLTTSRAACARRKYRGSLVCFKKVSKISRASSGKCSLRVRMRGVSIIKYYKNIKILCQTTGFPSYQNKTFPPQISQELLLLVIQFLLAGAFEFPQSFPEPLRELGQLLPAKEKRGND